MPFVVSYFLWFLCLFSFCYQLLYVDSLDVSGLDDLDLPEAKLAVNRWPRENIYKVLSFNLIDKHIYGKLEVIFVCLNELLM
jgi:hypothetical protein